MLLSTSALVTWAACPASAPPDAGLTCEAGFELDAGACAPSCPAGQQRLSGACVPATPGSPCDAGTMPVVGSSECAPVGWTACPDGFEPDPSGWGCAAVLPEARCTGATRAALGSRECLPLGDCSAAFPPPSATVFVSPSGPLDATHFHDVASALAQAPRGATIAVEAGDYAGPLVVTRPVTLVGRCAQLVSVHATAPGLAGLQVARADVRVTGFSFTGHDPGVKVTGGGRLVLGGVLIQGSKNSGVLATDLGTRLELTDVTVRDTQAVSGANGTGLFVQDGAVASLEQVELTNNHGGGALVRNTSAATPSTQVTAHAVVVDATQPAAAGQTSIGLLVSGGAQADAQVLALRDSSVIALMATGAGSRLTVSDAVLLRTGGDLFVRPSQLSAAVVQGQATLELRRVAFVDGTGGGLTGLGVGSVARLDQVVLRDANESSDARGDGVTIGSGARGELGSVVILRSRTVGLFVGTGSQVTAQRVYVAQTLADSLGRARAVSVEYGVLSATESSVSGALELGVFVGGADAGASLDRVLVEDIRGNQEVPTPYGHGVLTREQAVARIAGSVVRTCVGAGIISDSAGAGVVGTLLFDNAVGVHAQQGSQVVSVPALPAELRTDALLVAEDTLFIDDVARLGVGVMPVPPAVARP